MKRTIKSAIASIAVIAALAACTTLGVQEPTGPCTAQEIVERTRACDSVDDESTTREIGLLLSSIDESFARPGVHGAFCSRATPDRMGDLEQIMREQYREGGTALSSSQLDEDDFTFVFLHAVAQACD